MGYTRFKDQASITTEALAGEDIFPMTHMSGTGDNTKLDDKKLPYSELKEKLTGDILSNGALIETLEPTLLAPLANKLYTTDHKKITESDRQEIYLEAREKVEKIINLGWCQTFIDSQGTTNEMFVIPKITCEDLDPNGTLGEGTHPAFINKNIEKPFIAIARYQASNNGSGIPVSQYNKTPWVSVDFDTARANCLKKNAGTQTPTIKFNGVEVSTATGWHLMSIWDWALIQAWNALYGPRVKGNVSSSAAVGTGTGGNTYSHNGKANGIFDLVGNVWEWQEGMKKGSNEHIIMLENNDTSLMNNSGNESSWKDTGINNSNVNAGSEYGWWNSNQNMANSASDSIKLLLRRSLVVPAGPNYKTAGSVWCTTGERMPGRGGGWGDGASAGLAALALAGERSGSDTYIGFRFAFL